MVIIDPIDALPAQRPVRVLRARARFSRTERKTRALTKTIILRFLKRTFSYERLRARN